jgi:hypothetical protein
MRRIRGGYRSYKTKRGSAVDQKYSARRPSQFEEPDILPLPDLPQLGPFISTKSLPREIKEDVHSLILQAQQVPQAVAGVTGFMTEDTDSDGDDPSTRVN